MISIWNTISAFSVVSLSFIPAKKHTKIVTDVNFKGQFWQAEIADHGFCTVEGNVTLGFFRVRSMQLAVFDSIRN